MAIEDSVPTLMTLGQVLAIEGNSRAAEIWARVLKEEPENCIAYIYLAMLAAKTGDNDRALLMVKKAEELQTRADQLVEIASVYAEVGQYQTALDKYLCANQLGDEPKAPLYAGIAACYFALGDTNAGCRYIKDALSLQPDNPYVREIWEAHRAVCGGN